MAACLPCRSTRSCLQAIKERLPSWQARLQRLGVGMSQFRSEITHSLHQMRSLAQHSLVLPQRMQAQAAAAANPPTLGRGTGTMQPPADSSSMPDEQPQEPFPAAEVQGANGTTRFSIQLTQKPACEPAVRPSSPPTSEVSQLVRPSHAAVCRQQSLSALRLQHLLQHLMQPRREA